MRRSGVAMAAVCSALALGGCLSAQRDLLAAGTTPLRVETSPSAVMIAVSFTLRDGTTKLSRCVSPCDILVPNGAGIQMMFNTPEGYIKPADPRITWSCDIAAGVCSLSPNPLRVVMQEKSPPPPAKP